MDLRRGSNLLPKASLGISGLIIFLVLLVQLQTLRPTTSFTVPPSTSFSSRPLSFVPTESASGSGAGPKGQSSKGQTSQTNTKTNEKSKANEDDMEVDEPDSADQNPSREPLRVTAVGVVPQGKDLPAVWIWEGEEGAEKRVIKVSPLRRGV